MNETIQKYGTAILVGAVIFMIILTAYAGYEYGKRKICERSNGMVVTDTETGKQFCLINNEGQKAYCAELLRIGEPRSLSLT